MLVLELLQQENGFRSQLIHQTFRLVELVDCLVVVFSDTDTIDFIIMLIQLEMQLILVI